MAVAAYNTSLVPLVQKPESPDKAIKKGTIGEAQVARLSHVNALAKDVYQLKVYTADFSVGDTATLNICSKKGIINFANFDTTSSTFDITLVNPEIEQFLMYAQLTVLSTPSIGTIHPVAYVSEIIDGSITIRVKSIGNVPLDGTWGTITLFYELIKICS